MKTFIPFLGWSFRIGNFTKVGIMGWKSQSGTFLVLNANRVFSFTQNLFCILKYKINQNDPNLECSSVYIYHCMSKYNQQIRSKPIVLLVIIINSLRFHEYIIRKSDFDNSLSDGFSERFHSSIPSDTHTLKLRPGGSNSRNDPGVWLIYLILLIELNTLIYVRPGVRNNQISL